MPEEKLNTYLFNTNDCQFKVDCCSDRSFEAWNYGKDNPGIYLTTDSTIANMTSIIFSKRELNAVALECGSDGRVNYVVCRLGGWGVRTFLLRYTMEQNNAILYSWVEVNRNYARDTRYEAMFRE